MLELFLNTTSDLFVRWIENHTRNVDMGFYPEKDGYVLHPARVSSQRGKTTTIEMQGTVYTHIDEQAAQHIIEQGAWIQFEVLPLASERIEVKAQCKPSHHKVRLYFLDLLLNISKRWPEAGRDVLRYYHEVAPALDIEINSEASATDAEQRKPSPHPSTLEKLELLRDIRRQSIRNGHVTIGKIQACRDAKITSKTVHTHAQDLLDHWDEADYP